MEHVSIVGIDLAKSVFQLHGAGADGQVLFRRKLSRPQFRRFLQKQSSCVVAMEACATAHYWGRELTSMGHHVRLIPPSYVKPFVKRQKNDAADAEAIVEAAQRPEMRFVAIKSTEQQSLAMLLKTRDMLVRQQTQLINALRGHLMEFGVTAPAGKAFVGKLSQSLSSKNSELPDLVIDLGQLHLDQIKLCADIISQLDQRIRIEARQDQQTKRLQTAPGIGAINALAIRAFAPEMGTFRSGRDFAAWLGLVPRQNSTGGKARLGRMSKMGQRDIRRLLVLGAMSRIRWAARSTTEQDPWLSQMLTRKPKMLVAIALANKMARAAWAMVTKGEDFRMPAGTA